MFESLKKDWMERNIISSENFLVRCLAYVAICFVTVLISKGNLNSLPNVDDSQAAAVITSSFSEMKPVGNDDPSLASGVSGISDFTENMPYIDLMHLARKFAGTPKGQLFGSYTNKMLKDKGYLDEHGWPKAIPPELSDTGIMTVWAYGKNATYGGDAHRAGTYVLTYEGQGIIKFSLDAKVVSTATGTITITTTGGAMGMTIVNTDPLKTGDYIRNMSFVKKENIPLFKAGAIFNPDYITKIKDLRQLRFMDVMLTNGSEMVTWDEMPTEEDVSWRPMPIAIQVRLANEVGADPWFNIPFRANDEFVRNFATYVHEHLDPKLVASVEFSNEVWNFSFDQAHDALVLAEAEYGVKGGAGWVNYYGERASKVMKIWTEVYGADTKTRLVRIAATQTANPSILTNVLEAPIWKKAKPNEYVAPYTYFDAAAVTTYFGGRFIQDQALLDQVLSQPTIDAQNELHKNMLSKPVTIAGTITFTQKSKVVTTSVPIAGLSGFQVDGMYYRIDKPTSSTTFALREVWASSTVTKNQIQYWVNDSHLMEIKRELEANKDIAAAHNLRLVSYEGGQHVHHSAFVNLSDAQIAAMQPHLISFVRSPQMADLYAQLWDMWKGIGDGPFMQFGDVGVPPTKYGSWGLYTTLVDSNPRATKLMDLNQSTKAWWENRTGAHFQQGLTLTAPNTPTAYIGTSQEDYLIGTDGNETFYPGRGNDGVNGGAGVDKVYFKGNKAQYAVAKTMTGYTVTGPEGVDYLYAVELLVFTDGTIDVSGNSSPLDPDEDSIIDGTDNCPAVFNPGQENYDTDVQGDACDADDDNDGILDTAEKVNCQFNADLTCGGTTATTTPPVPPKPKPTPTPTPTSTPIVATTSINFSFIPNPAAPGQKVGLSWRTVGFTSCVASGTWSGNKALQGSEILSAINAAGSYPYSLTCTGQNGTKSITRSLTVKSTTATTSAVFSSSSVALVIAPDAIGIGQTTHMNWWSKKALTCTASGDWSGVKPVQGNENLGPFTTVGNKTYTLECTDGVTTITKSRILKVKAVEATTTAPSLNSVGDVIPQ